MYELSVGAKVGAMRRLLISRVIMVFLVSASMVSADWLKGGYFSPQSGIDSINRVVQLKDPVDNTLFGWKICGSGDANGDGIDDLLVGRQRSGYAETNWTTNHAFLYYGGAPPDSHFVSTFTKMEGMLGNLGDINKDGFDEIGVSFGEPNSIEIHFGGPQLDDSADLVINGYWSHLRKAVDFNGDGILELALSKDISGGSGGR